MVIAVGCSGGLPVVVEDVEGPVMTHMTAVIMGKMVVVIDWVAAVLEVMVVGLEEAVETVVAVDAVISVMAVASMVAVPAVLAVAAVVSVADLVAVVALTA